MQMKLNVDFQVTLGTIKKWRQQGSGEGRGCPKLVTKSDIGGSEVHANSEITTKKNMCKFKKDLVLLVNSCIFLIFKYTLGKRLGTDFIDLQACCLFYS